MLNNLSLGKMISSCEQEFVNLFAMHFSLVYNCDLPNNVSFSVDDFYQGFSVLRGVWSVGPNGLCGEFLFHIIHIIAYPLWTLFRRWLDKGIFPTMLKISSITSIPKSGSHSIISNYRPISVQSYIKLCI